MAVPPIYNRSKRGAGPLGVKGLETRYSVVSSGHKQPNRRHGPFASSDPRTMHKVVIATSTIGDVRLDRRLIVHLHDKSSKVRAAAALQLGRPGNTGALAPLVRALDDRNWKVRRAAAIALGRVGDASAADALRDMLKGSRRTPGDLLVRDAVLRALRELQDVTPSGDNAERNVPGKRAGPYRRKGRTWRGYFPPGSDASLHTKYWLVVEGGSGAKGGLTIGEGDFVARDESILGDKVAGDKVGADKVGGDKIAHDKYVIHVGSGATPQDVATAADLVRRLEPPPALQAEPIRLDVAAPRSVTVGRYFQLAIAVKQPDSPPLSIADLPDVTSGEGEIFRSPDQPIVQYRVELSAPDFEIPQPSYVFRLEAGRDSKPRYFQMKALCAGTLPVLVNAYQIMEEEDLVAQTRLTVQVLLEVVEGQGGGRR